MVRYPKFLENKPRFFGLTLVDLALFALIVNILNFMSVEGITLALVSIAAIVLKVLACKWIDFTALFVSYPRVESFSWREEIEAKKGEAP